MLSLDVAVVLLLYLHNFVCHLLYVVGVLCVLCYFIVNVDAEVYLLLSLCPTV